VYSRDMGSGNSREEGRECTVGTRVAATVGRGGGGDLSLTPRAPGRWDSLVMVKARKKVSMWGSVRDHAGVDEQGTGMGMSFPLPAPPQAA